MRNNDFSTDYGERAHMHEVLADSTADPEARKMHRAMASAYRRKAQQEGLDSMGSMPAGGRVLEVAIPIGQRV